MKNIYLIILISVFVILMGCSKETTEDYLVGGSWLPESGYDSGEKVGEPMCIPLDEGIKFKIDGIVYVEAFERDFEYLLLEEDNNILFRDTGPNLDPKSTPDYGVDYFSYDIKILSNDEMVLQGRGFLENKNCYMVRKSN